MEIVIGSIPSLGQQPDKPPGRQSAPVEARLLHARPPRRGIAGPAGVERRGRKTRDPAKGKVLTLMVLDADALPKDIESAEYRVTLRFQRV